MSKFKINDIKLDGSELLNDSETFFSDLKDNEMDDIVGGLISEPMDKSLLVADLEDKAHTTTVYIPKEPICYIPREPICCFPVKPIKPIKPICPTKPILIFNPCPVIL